MSLRSSGNIKVMKYVASLIETPETDLAEFIYKNATNLSSFNGSKVHAKWKQLSDRLVIQFKPCSCKARQNIS
ncbi:hypothetical protein GUJ93_ZPchr0014g47501 [Zizania palustris]|uniref:Uncharacterized protein n=1 Tax=Zizania palustris TaxID=103762 RepID=A0A8J5TG73_ZIZPA|nr:hypothetical protein GUJ93_ZPchr0014g47501 [Zizania palustris]